MKQFGQRFTRAWLVAVLATGATACRNESPDTGTEPDPCKTCGDATTCSRETVVAAEPNPCLVPIAIYDGTSDLVLSVAWSPLDDYVLSGSNGDVRLFEVTGEPPEFRLVATYGDQGGRTFVAWSPDGEYALSASTDVRLLRVDRERATVEPIAPPFTAHSGDIYTVAWSPDGTPALRHALSVGEDGIVRLLAADVAAGTLVEVARFDGGTGRVYDVAFSPSGELAAIAAQDGTLRVLAVDARAGTLVEVARSLEDAWVTAVAWSPRGAELLVGTWLPCGTVELKSLEAPASLRTVGVFAHHDSGMRVAHFGPTGDFAITAGHDDTVRLFALPTAANDIEAAATWADNTFGVHGVSLSRDGERLVVAASHFDRLTLLDKSACALP